MDIIQGTMYSQIWCVAALVNVKKKKEKHLYIIKVTVYPLFKKKPQ